MPPVPGESTQAPAVLCMDGSIKGNSPASACTLKAAKPLGKSDDEKVLSCKHWPENRVLKRSIKLDSSRTLPGQG